MKLSIAYINVAYINSWENSVLRNSPGKHQHVKMSNVRGTADRKVRIGRSRPDCGRAWMAHEGFGLYPNGVIATWSDLKDLAWSDLCFGRVPLAPGRGLMWRETGSRKQIRRQLTVAQWQVIRACAGPEVAVRTDMNRKRRDTL